MPHPSVLRVRIFSWVYPVSQRVDGDQSWFAFGAVRPTAPRPILRMGYQFPRQGVSVHVNQFFPHLLFAPHVEIVEAPGAAHAGFACAGLDLTATPARMPSPTAYEFRSQFLLTNCYSWYTVMAGYYCALSQYRQHLAGVFAFWRPSFDLSLLLATLTRPAQFWCKLWQ